MSSKQLFPWDAYSDQPYILKRETKKALRKGHGLDYLKLIATNLIYFPYLFIRFLIKKKTNHSSKTTNTNIGLCVNVDKGQEQHALIEELGVKSLQIRVFLNDMNNIDKYIAFAKGFGENKEFLITIIQDREHIENHKLLIQDITIIFKKFENMATEFQIGNAINRIKWSFISMEEYLAFYKSIQEIRDKHFPNIKLIGSSIIDFEYHFSIRTLFNNYKIHYDKFSTLLYVDRRGSPYSTQMGFFNFKNKIEFLDTIVRNTKKSENSIYITEANWPLSNTAPYAPTSEKECVSEKFYAQYMLEYFEIALKTNKIEKIFWHQLIAPGYGLVDNREEKIRKTEAFYAFKNFLNKKNPQNKER
ncbi:MAG: FIG00388565: hypothetical protein [uncultured Sulfurovum sp.]|uniref:Arabinogalactan endo-beta-1,4-galactanase n=1 Tax=uncultured Sulfurovum sp. TaxID=269237 RepID=A0A6S6T9I7_9BACT|nr:MAG: FIG00388565: hypothetical protein [uncultured Sulfurovum sp.]